MWGYILFAQSVRYIYKKIQNKILLQVSFSLKLKRNIQKLSMTLSIKYNQTQCVLLNFVCSECTLKSINFNKKQNTLTFISV